MERSHFKRGDGAGMVYRVRIGWGDIDFARNIFWARYFPYVEHAIGEWLTAKGFDWRKLVDEKNLGMPAVRLDVRFVRPVRLQEMVRIQLAVRGLTRRGCRFAFYIYREGDGELCASGYVSRRFIDAAKFRGTELPDDMYGCFLEMQEESRGVGLGKAGAAAAHGRPGDGSGS